MTVESALLRIDALQRALSDPSTLLLAARTGGTAASAAPLQGGGEGSGESATPSFADTLQSASAGSGASVGPYATSPLAASSLPGALGSATSPGARVAQIAESQVGQSEQPPGSNEGPAIAEYRTATAGAAPGEPWCAYFASWAARQAGVPIGPSGEGLGSVSEIWSWAQSTGRAIARGPGVTPEPGDLIVFGSEHVGIVKDVLPNGQVQTIEGNYDDKVSENVRSPSEATGYVQLG